MALPQIVVPDTLRALQRLAAAWRAEFDIPIVAVGGSNGKTTAKEMTAAILSRMGPCMATRGNFNNHIGVPLTLMRLDPTHRSAVVEMGANRLGDVAELVTLAQPTVGLITNAGAEHLEGFVDLDGVAKGEGEMVAGLAPTATAIINADDPYAAYWRSVSNAGRVVTFGIHGDGQPAERHPAGDRPAGGSSAERRPAGDQPAEPRPAGDQPAEPRPAGGRPADFSARGATLGIEDAVYTGAVPAGGVQTHAAPTGGEFATRFTLVCPLGEREILSRAGGTHNIVNALAAAAAATAAGASLDDVVSGLADFRPVAGRLQLKAGLHGSWIIDDSYNANPSSVLAALEVLRSLSGTTWLVLADMAELGEHSADSHAAMGVAARDCGVARLFGMGPQTAGAVEAFGPGGEWFEGAEALIQRLQAELTAGATTTVVTTPGATTPGVTVLVKGSRVNRLERVVRALTGGGS